MLYLINDANSSHSFEISKSDGTETYIKWISLLQESKTKGSNLTLVTNRI